MGKNVLKLRKPIMVDGVEKTELEYDLDSLSGDDVKQAVNDLQNAGIMPTIVELDINYHAAIFAKATGLDFVDMSRLSARDYTKATALVRDFFLADVEE